ncbi:MAG: hypothetical protein HZB56_05555 [Deltaproteobacteria bacterium]|nr:hypothetical protein [Deltaproteobacteria bacterium]
MPRRARFALATLAALAPLLGGAAERPRTVTILYLADLGATVEPCGCSENQRGGLPRLATAVEKVRREGNEVVLLGGGDLLFEGPLADDRRPADLAKARVVAEALRSMGLAGSVRGERDLAAGGDFLRKLRLPFSEGGRQGPVAYGVPGRVPRAPIRVGILHRGGTRAALPLAEQARAQGLTLLLAAHREKLTDDDLDRAVLDAAVPVVQVQGRGQSLARIDVRLAGDPARGFAVLPGTAQREEELSLLELRAGEYRRRQEAADAAGNLDLSRALAAKVAELAERARAERAAPPPAPPDDRPSLTVSFIPISADLPEEPRLRRLVTRHYGEVARMNLAAARKQGRPCPDPRVDQAAIIGLDTAPPGGRSACQDCHPAAVAQWRGTSHARAYATLEQGPKGPRQFDLDCVGCHVTGWGAPGGACNVAAVEGRKDVQCESCHGPASLHAVDPPGHILRSPGEDRCRTCHTPEHSTAFEWEGYRARILGPGHGAPGRGG